MALTLFESTDSLNPEKINPLFGENYELTLNQSIQNLLAEIGDKNLTFSQFVQRFHEFIQARDDPPMESIWFYSAVTFRSLSFSNGDVLDRVVAIKNLFQLVSSCSAPCHSSKTIALLAPVVSEVYKVILELIGNELTSKRERKAMREVKSLVEVILGFINLSYSKGLDQNDELVDINLNCSLMDLASVWINPDEGLEQFLPLVSSEIRRGFSSGVCDVHRLAGVVIAEAFLMKLCLYFHSGSSRQDMEKDLRIWAVGSITGIKNIYFFETLVRIQLEVTLPVMSLLSTEDEVLLRKVLFDALVLVDYSFLNPEKTFNCPAEHVTFLAVKRLILTHEAIEFFRLHGDQSRAISYLNAFSSSRLSSQIIKWIRSQIPDTENVNQPNGLSPKLLIEWLLKAEDQGIRVFDDSISNYRAKLVLNISKSDSDYPMSKGDKADDDNFFYIDNQGEKGDNSEEDKVMDESVNAAFVTAAHTMSTTENGSGKQKRRKKAGRKNKIKFIKYDLSLNSDSTKLKSAVDDNASNSEGEVQNPSSDEDTRE